MTTKSTPGSRPGSQAYDTTENLNDLITDVTAIRTSIGGVISGSATFNPADLADGAGETTTVTATGAALGDFALASFSLDLQGITVTAYVSAADTVTVRLQNESGGAIDLASGTLRVRVLPQATFAAPAAITAEAVGNLSGTAF
jgi:hypothetical protein